eukprot:75661-Prorocentrum_minimum.AAC.2
MSPNLLDDDVPLVVSLVREVREEGHDEGHAEAEGVHDEGRGGHQPLIGHHHHLHAQLPRTPPGLTHQYIIKQTSVHSSVHY